MNGFDWPVTSSSANSVGPSSSSPAAGGNSPILSSCPSVKPVQDANLKVKVDSGVFVLVPDTPICLLPISRNISC